MIPSESAIVQQIRFRIDRDMFKIPFECDLARIIAQVALGVFHSLQNQGKPGTYFIMKEQFMFVICFNCKILILSNEEDVQSKGLTSEYRIGSDAFERMG